MYRNATEAVMAGDLKYLEGRSDLNQFHQFQLEDGSEETLLSLAMRENNAQIVWHFLAMGWQIPYGDLADTNITQYFLNEIRHHRSLSEVSKLLIDSGRILFFASYMPGPREYESVFLVLTDNYKTKYERDQAMRILKYFLSNDERMARLNDEFLDVWYSSVRDLETENDDYVNQILISRTGDYIVNEANRDDVFTVPINDRSKMLNEVFASFDE